MSFTGIILAKLIYGLKTAGSIVWWKDCKTSPEVVQLIAGKKAETERW